MPRETFDELLSLRRLLVAVRRGDWRMFEQGLSRLDAEIAAGFPFTRHQAWQACLQESQAHGELPGALKEALRESIARLLSLEVRVAPAAGEPGTLAEAPSPLAAGGLAVIDAWRSSLTATETLSGFRAWLGTPGAGPARELLAGWLTAPGASLAALVDRANLTLAAREAGLAIAEPSWLESFHAGLARLVEGAPSAFPAEPADLLAAGAPVSLVVAEPGVGWAAPYTEAGIRVLRLAGAIDWFVCQRCQHDARVAGASPRPVVVACDRCGAPAWPLVVPLDNAAFMPPVLRNEWARAARALREAPHWVVVEPPDDPTSGAFQGWLLDQMTPGKRVTVVGGNDASLAAWQACLAERELEALVTSRGPASSVLGFLLRGGADGLSAPEATPAVVGDRRDPRKKLRR